MNNLAKLFHLPSFIISLAIGIFIVYIQTPDFEKILVYPNPDNEDKILYQDKTDTCYKMTSTEVSCPQNEKDIREYPVQ
jgi:hypothetical protein